MPPWEIRGKTGYISSTKSSEQIPRPSIQVLREMSDPRLFPAAVAAREIYEVTLRRLCSAIVRPAFQSNGLRWFSVPALRESRLPHTLPPSPITSLRIPCPPPPSLSCISPKPPPRAASFGEVPGNRRHDGFCPLRIPRGGSDEIVILTRFLLRR